MPPDTPTTDPLDNFAAIAEAYCALIERFRSVPADVLLASVQPAIATLYAAGLALPPLPAPDAEDADEEEADDLAPPWLGEASGSAPPDPDHMAHADWWSLYKSLTAYLGPRNNYREIFDPYEPPSEKEVTGSLADDLADIYRDLLRGCRKWARGERTEAHWEWRFGLENHWGEHATGALRAIHCLAAWHSLPWPSPDGAV